MRPALVALLASCALAACAAHHPSPSPPAPAPVALWFAGDAHVGASLPRLFSTAAPPAITRGALGVVNLEGPLVERADRIDEAHLVNAVDALGALREAGVRVLTLANNHALDEGPAGPATTARLARGAGFVVAGGPVAAGDAVLVERGMRVVVAPRDLTGGVPDGLAADLAAARRRGDALVVAFHVTAPRRYLPEPALRRAADIALAAGASIVVAHGTHTVGSVERRGRALIAWGLGNLVFGCACGDGTEGLVLRATLDPRTGAAGEAAVLPIEAGLHGAPAIPGGGEQGATLDLLDAIGAPRFARDDAGAGWF